MPLVDRETGALSTYYQTAKKIFNYAKDQKDSKGIEYPILGICQGLEVLSELVNNDDRLTLSNVVKYGVSTTQSWTTDPKGSQMFADFPDASL